MSKSVLTALADAVWPPVCPVRSVPVDASGRLDAAAWQGLEFIDAPWCDCCGVPFPYGTGIETGGLLCALCLARPPKFDRARAPLVYGDVSRQLVLGFKNGGRREMIDQFGAWMARAGASCLSGADYILPVPLHWRRLLTRRYNQSALLGQALSRQTGIPMRAGWLLRSRATPSQAGKSVLSRRRNMAGAFRIAPGHGLDGRHVVLVDDVFTTGATASACARQLRRAGAALVTVVTLCRVVRASDATM
ncbi:ComF family protein [Maricaulis sp.]|uniref:ComF family protein n=1 Tax=Maricaulis sp. TaxID=1486257 RepID=UPI003A911E83